MEADTREDWLLDSLDKYEGIYMFELQYPTFCLEWEKDASAVWVVCRSERNCEILQLALPERLLPPDVQSLWAKRDFKMMRGVLINGWITALKPLLASGCVISGNSDGILQIWSNSEHSSDLLEASEEFKLPSLNISCPTLLLDTSFTHPDLVLASSSHSLTSLCLFHLATKQVMFQPHTLGMDYRVHHASFLNESTQLVTCTGPEGRISIWDWRACPEKPTIDLPVQSSDRTVASSYSLASNSAGTSPSVQLACLDSNGKLNLFDTRQPTSLLASANFHSNNDTVATRFSQSGDQPLPCIKYSSRAPHVLSTSGVHQGIKIYDTSTWSHDMSDSPPLFVHDGHEMEDDSAYILTHCWQPTKGGDTLPAGGTMLSTDSQGSLHAWQWRGSH